MKDAQTVERPAGSGPRSHDVGPTGAVVISTTLDSIVVRGVDGQVARLVGPDEPEILSEATPGRFVVRTPSAPDWPTAGRGRSWLGSVLSLGRSGRTIELEVPRGAELEINTASGAAQVTGVRGGIAIHTTSGDVRAHDAGGAVRVSTASGSVVLVGPDRLAARVRTASGDVRIAAHRLADLSVSTMSGSVVVVGAVEPGLDATVSTASGAVRLAVSGGVTVAVRTVSGKAASTHPEASPGTQGPGWTIGDGAGRIAVSTISGGIRLELPTADAAAQPGAAGEPAVTTDPGQSDTASGPAEPSPARADDPTMAVLRALERGEIGIDEAARRLDPRHLEGDSLG